MIDAMRREHGHTPGHRRAPVMADYVCFLDSQRVHDPDHVCDYLGQRIVGDVRRPIAAAAPTHVGSDGAKARGGEGRHLVPPHH